jgi:hypothetical protein
MPLAWDRAYGGRTISKDRRVPFPDNPRGKGYVLDRARVGGTDLPNLEDPAASIRSWHDQPQPLAFSPIPPGSALIDVEDQDADVGGKGGGGRRPVNAPSTTGNPSGGGRGNNPPRK